MTRLDVGPGGRGWSLGGPGPSDPVTFTEGSLLYSNFDYAAAARTDRSRKLKKQKREFRKWAGPVR